MCQGYFFDRLESLGCVGEGSSRALEEFSQVRQMRAFFKGMQEKLFFLFLLLEANLCLAAVLFSAKPLLFMASSLPLFSRAR